MSNARIAWRFASDAATTISASTSAYQAGPEKLIESSPSTLWSTTTAGTSEYVTFGLSAATSIRAFSLLNHNLDGTETDLEVSGHTSNSWGSPSFTHTITHRTGKLVECFTAAQSYQWWRFSFTKASAADVRTAGRLTLGPYYELPRNVARSGFRWGWSDLSESQRTISGVRNSDIGAKLRTLRASMSLVTEPQADELNLLAQTYGKHTPFLFLGDHSNEPLDWMVYGTLTKLVSQNYDRYSDGGHMWGLDLSMEEMK